MSEAVCGWCGVVAQVAYTDVLGIEWCQVCFQDTFLENFTPTHAPAQESTDAEARDD